MSPSRRGYRPISDHALIGDCHATALVCRDGSIDWCCLPRFDSGSCFGRLLDRRGGGFCSIEPDEPVEETSREYLDGTLVLSTTFRTEEGQASVTDCFTVGRDGPRRDRQLLRIVEGQRGRVRLRLRVAPRFDYGEIRPWLRRHGPRLWSAIGGNDGLVIAGEDTLIVGDGFSCKTQIAQMTERRALHTAQVIRMAMEHGPEGVSGNHPETPYPDVIRS